MTEEEAGVVAPVPSLHHLRLQLLFDPHLQVYIVAALLLIP
jgi:hypothetical protein